MPELEEVERSGAMISKLALPETLAGNTQRLERYKLALLSAVESLYRDKKKPFLGELKRLLKPSKQWLNQELRAAATVCASDASRYFLVPPFAGEPPCILLRQPPPGFDEWYCGLPVKSQRSEDQEATRQLEASIGCARALTMREVIDSFYKDCIEPSLPEVQQRLRLRGWTFVESQQAVLLYACQKSLYQVCKPTCRKPVVILLKEPPNSFSGWFDGIGVVPQASAQMEFGLKSLLAAGFAPRLSGGVAGAAEILQEHCPRSLGELRALLRVFLKKGLLRYDGDELVASKGLEKELRDLQVTPRTPERRKARIYCNI